VSLRAVAVEARADRAARIVRNAAAFGVPALDVVHGTVPNVLSAVIARESGRSTPQAPGSTGCPAFAGHDGGKPDAIFIGGGCSDAVLDAAIAALRTGGRLVVNAVTLETEGLLIARHAGHGGTLTRIAIERAEPIGGMTRTMTRTMTTWRPALPVTQWCWIKPGSAP
jgi:precorrin-6Y C5,15-methyltransferase (decarboxylating)